MTKRQSPASRLALEHWQYIQQLLELTFDETRTFTRAELLDHVRFHYTTAFHHGWKHAEEERA